MNGTMNKKRIGLIVLTLALICALAVGGTLAYLTANANNKTNHFTFVQGDSASGLSIVLYENAWDGTTAENPTLTDKQTAALTDTGLGVVQARTVMPSSTVLKDPTIKNNGAQTVWTAMKIALPEVNGYTFGGNSGNEIQFNGKTVATLNLANGVTVSKGNNANEAVIFFAKPLAVNETVTAFDSVTFSKELTNDDVKAMGSFDLVVSGYAVQETGLEASNGTTCKAAITGAFDEFKTLV